MQDRYRCPDEDRFALQGEPLCGYCKRMFSPAEWETRVEHRRWLVRKRYWHGPCWQFLQSLGHW